MKNTRGFYDIFLRTCAKYPSNIAVRVYRNDAFECYTYSELYGVCEYISQVLQQLNCTNGIIGLVSKTQFIIPCVIAAAHKWNTIYMFLDPSQDIDEVITDMKFSMVIAIMDRTEAANVDNVIGKKADKIITMFGMSIMFYDYGSLSGSNYKFTQDHSFIAMTSGSTGKPKKIQVPFRCIQPNIDDLTKIFHITPQDIIYFSTPLTFDPSMVEILLACMNGASLLIAPARTELLFPVNKEHSITVWQTTPSKFFQFSNVHIKKKILHPKSTLKILALGGEPLNNVKRLKELKHNDNKTKIFTLYGVTEMSCWASVAELDFNKISSDREIPLGKCLSETKIVVENDPKSITSCGKIVLVSKTRQCIILNKKSAGEDLVSLKFVDTGDLAEVSPNGAIYYRGRKDDVIKRFGHKINLQFIESTVMQCPRIKSCSCIWLPKPKLVVVYFSSETFSSQDLSDFLKCKLDDRHWPDRIVRVDNMPTTMHGKISKFVLSKMLEKPTDQPITINALKAKFLQELKTMLNTSFTYDSIKDKGFFALGGTSFLAVTLCNNISYTYAEFGKLLLPLLMNQNKTIDEIMKQVLKKVCTIDPTEPATKRIKITESEVIESASEDCNRNISNPPVEFIEMWTYNTGKCVDATPSILLCGVNLYVAVGSHSGIVVVVDAMTGIVVGTKDLGARVEAGVFCYNGDPALPACGIVGAYDGTVISFALGTCQLLWRNNIQSMIKSKATCTNGLVYIASYDGYIRILDLKTGDIKGAIQITNQAISADLILAKNEFIMIGTLSGVCAGFHTQTNTVAWRATLDSPIFASPALYDNDKYVVFAEVSGEIHSRTVGKGIKIWSYNGAKGNIFSSIYIREIDKMRYQMFFGCHDNSVYSISVKNFQPSLQWRVPMSSAVYSTPCGLNDKFILAASNNGKLTVISADYGVVVAEYTIPGETFSSPAVHGDYIFIGCRNDLIYSLKWVLHV